MSGPNTPLEFNVPLVPGQYFSYDVTQASKSTPGALQNLVLIGQRTAAGQFAAGVLTPIVAADQAGIYFGVGSVLHLMASAALRANPNLALSACAVDDAGGSIAATATVTITGLATGVGVVSIKIGNSEIISIAVAAGDSPATVATALNARLSQMPDLPVTATVDAGVVTISAKNKGAQGNGIKLAASNAVPGIAVAAVQFSGGATEPSLTPALTAIQAAGHDLIAVAATDAASLTALRAHLDMVSGPIEQRDAMGVYAQTGTFTPAATLALALNSQVMTCAWLRSTDSLPCEVAAAYAAVIASEPDPVRPLNGLALEGIDPPDLVQHLTGLEKGLALKSGLTPIEVGPGQRVQIVRAVTARTLDSRGNPSQTLFDISGPRGLSAVRKAVKTRMAERFPRAKGTKRNLKKVRSELLNVLLELEKLEWVQDIEAHKAEIIVERDSSVPGQFNAIIPAPIVPGLHVIAGSIRLYL